MIASPANVGSQASLDRGDNQDPVVIIVDDDASIRQALTELMLSAGLKPLCFASVTELLEADAIDEPGCLILDVRMPGASGLDLQRHLLASGNSRPTIFLTGHGDIPMTVEAMKSGAVDFLTKPVRDQTLLDAIKVAFERDKEQRERAQIVKDVSQRFGTLTGRERQVFSQVAAGRLNKQIAFDLGISEVTVKLHRSNVMRKMGTATIGALIRSWEALPEKIRAFESASPPTAASQ